MITCLDIEEKKTEPNLRLVLPQVAGRVIRDGLVVEWVSGEGFLKNLIFEVKPVSVY